MLTAAALLLHVPIMEGAIFLGLSIAVSLVYTALLLSYLETKGVSMIGISPLAVFKSFLVDWLEKRNESFEKFLEKFGVEQQTDVSVMGFKAKDNQRLKGILVVMGVHPGPFLNVGSSVLPYLVQEVVEAKSGAIVAVPHGVSGHELNLVSQRENDKVILEIVRLTKGISSSDMATGFMRRQRGAVSASCQGFGDYALVTITKSPQDMEDIPLEVGSEMRAEARRYFRDAAIVDSHNSIKRVETWSDMELEDLRYAVKDCVSLAGCSARHPFKVGVSKAPLNEFSLNEGIGPGGLVTFLIEVNGKQYAYVVIDGNNMRATLRERIMGELKRAGVDDGEVMTTDTHMVNGLVSARLGYHPVGDAIDEDLLIERILQSVVEAREDLEEASASLNSSRVKVKALGTNALANLTEFVYSVARLVAASLIPVIIVSTLSALVFLA